MNVQGAVNSLRLPALMLLYGEGVHCPLGFVFFSLGHSPPRRMVDAGDPVTPGGELEDQWDADATKYRLRSCS